MTDAIHGSKPSVPKRPTDAYKRRLRRAQKRVRVATDTQGRRVFFAAAAHRGRWGETWMGPYGTQEQAVAAALADTQAQSERMRERAAQHYGEEV